MTILEAKRPFDVVSATRRADGVRTASRRLWADRAARWVVTGGGLLGKVTKVGDTEVEVELGQGIKVTAVKSTLTQVVDPASAKERSDRTIAFFRGEIPPDMAHPGTGS